MSENSKESIAQADARELSKINIVDCLRHFAETQPEHPAMEDGHHVINYTDLNFRTDEAAVNIRTAGIAQGDIVTVLLRDSIEHLIVLCGLARLGAVIFSLAPNLPIDEVGVTMKRVGAKFVITDNHSMRISGAVVLDREEICTANGKSFGQPGGRGYDPYVLVQSSGTTGKPKSFTLSHAQSSHRIKHDTKYLEIGRRDRFVCLSNMYLHICRATIFCLLANGATYVLARDRSPAALVDFINSKEISFLRVVPVNLMELLDYTPEGELLFPNLRGIVCGSAPITAQQRQLISERLTRNFTEEYGTNEVGAVAISRPHDQALHPESVGRLIEESEIQIVDADDRVLPSGSSGRIRLRCPGMIECYIDDPTMSAHHFRDGWYYPGDIAKVNGDGYLFFEGRADDIINNAGTKFYPIEVEEMLLRHPAVLEAAVFPLPHDRVGQYAGAAVVVDRAVTHQELMDFCAARLPRFKLPYSLVFLNELPRNPMGKVLRRKLAAQLTNWVRRQSRE